MFDIDKNATSKRLMLYMHGCTYSDAQPESFLRLECYGMVLYGYNQRGRTRYT